MGIGEVFLDRIERLRRAVWGGEEGGGEGSDLGVDAVVVCTGKIGDDGGMTYLKSYALFAWLFGEELQDSMLVIRRTEGAAVGAPAVDILIWVLDVSVKEALGKLAAPQGGSMKVELCKGGSAMTDEEMEGVVKQGSKWGLLLKEDDTVHAGEFFSHFWKRFGAMTDAANVADSLAAAMAVKDEIELGRVKKAATVTTAVFRNFAIPEIEDILDKEKSVSHQKLSDLIEEALLDPEAKAKLKGVRKQILDSCYPPIIQSGGKYDLKASAQSDTRNLTSGCVIISFGSRYGLYCSNATRTFLIDPSDAQKRNYEMLLEAFRQGLEAFVPGKPLNSVYASVSKRLGDSLRKHLSKNVGFLVGIEYREGAYVLNSKNPKLFEAGMTFNFGVGLSDLEDASNGKYALMVADTVAVTRSAPEVFTSNIRKEYSRIVYLINGDENELQDSVVVNAKSSKPPKASRDSSRPSLPADAEVNLANRPRRRREAVSNGPSAAVSVEEIEQRKKHQDELARKMREDGLARLRGSGHDNTDHVKDATGMNEYVAYRDSSAFPHSLRPRQLHVDMEAEALIVPINGIPVPFHISTIKNASKTEELSHTYLRINFNLPQAIGGSKLAVSKSVGDTLRFPDEDAHFVKELSFRAMNGGNLTEVLRKVKELRKRFLQREIAAAEAETLVEQAALELESGRRPTLADISMRPPLATGKYNTGTLEAHANGFRYRNVKGGYVDILYSNIKNQFFQEAKNETIVLIHFHLKNPIMIGKKATGDVQFYTEVMESAVKLSETRRNRHDQDELEEEQREREMRSRLNKMFLRFAREVEERHQLEFDAPYRQLGFHGAPYNSSVFLMPTVSCIVDLIDWPPFVLSLSEVEIAHFERVRFQLKNFDLVFVFKGFEREPRGKETQWTRISAIPMKEADSLKKYLDEQLIKYYEGTANLNWTNLLKTIRDDLEGFYEDGAWGFLELDDNKDDNGEVADEDDSLDEGDEAFEVSDEDLKDEDSESDDSDYSDEDDEVAGELSGDEFEGEAELDSDEEGKDWDELEEEAAKDDRRKGDFDDETKNEKKRVISGQKRSRGGR